MSTFFEELQAAGLPVVSADENGNVVIHAMNDEQVQLYNDIFISHFSPTEYADLLVFRADRQQLKTEYTNTIATLEQIQNTASPTNAQVIAAVKFLAKTIEIMLKLLARQYK